MPLVPPTPAARISFYEERLSAWGTNATAIGVTAADNTALETLVNAARNAQAAQQAAQTAAKTATLAFAVAVRDMQARGADMIRKIKAKAEGPTGGPEVYVLAQIPEPATPSPVPPPGTPRDFTVELLQGGAVQLSFKCPNPPGSVGTIYEVRRKPAAAVGADAFAYLGSTGVRKFTDNTLPVGSGPVVYQVTAVRSTSRGNPAEFNVTFGTGAAGQPTATLTASASSHPPRLAA